MVLLIVPSSWLKGCKPGVWEPDMLSVFLSVLASGGDIGSGDSLRNYRVPEQTAKASFTTSFLDHKALVNGSHRRQDSENKCSLSKARLIQLFCAQSRPEKLP